MYLGVAMSKCIPRIKIIIPEESHVYSLRVIIITITYTKVPYTLKSLVYTCNGPFLFSIILCVLNKQKPKTYKYVIIKHVLYAYVC